MGFLNYFKASAKPSSTESPTEKQRLPHASMDGGSEASFGEVNSSPFDSALASPKLSSGRPIGMAISSMRHELMANHLFHHQCARIWVHDLSGTIEGVLVRRRRGDYLSCPTNLVESSLASGIAALDVPCAMTVNNRTVRALLDMSPGAVNLPLSQDLRVQVLDNVALLSRARPAQCAAFLASEGLLVVWDDDVNNLVSRAAKIVEEMMDLVWAPKEICSRVIGDGDGDSHFEKKPPRVTVTVLDEESGEIEREVRPTHLLNTILVAFTICLIAVLLGAGYRQITIEIVVDQLWTRLALVCLTPVQIFFTLFFAQVIFGCLAQCFGPNKQMTVNSRFYSGMLPARIASRTLPHVTIQCPVYKEGLAGVIAPTVRSIKQAISTYELQGGSANIFINDDGLQLIDEREREARIDFYASNSIGWSARPKHGVDGFLRRGKFKKASNMNYGLNISCKVEAKLAEVDRHEGWTSFEEAVEYERCLREVLEEDPRAWADGNVRIGDYILIVDSDTRVPEDCLLDAVSEMEQSPEVGIMQFSSGVMQVVHTYFENGITFFTNLIYTAIKYTVSNGDVAPFVGHNAILRWSAIQEIGYFDEDGYEKFWSEHHVSEDFEMSLKLQCNGYIIRLAAWAGDGFKEGVSLTVYDELARWEKYAYGCNELLFNPIPRWLWKGPFTPLFRQFLFSNIRFTSKITILSYIGTYYAIGAAWIMTLANYFAVGWFNGYLDKYYIDSWKVWCSILVVFTGFGNVALAVLRYRLGERSFLGSLMENFKWTAMLIIFLGGLSLHVSQALLSHMFCIDMTWGSTSKEAEVSNFFIEVPRVLRRFKWCMGFAVLVIAMMIVLAKAPFVPWDWHITDYTAIVPLCSIAVSHFLLPIALNPALMTFTF